MILTSFLAHFPQSTNHSRFFGGFWQAIMFLLTHIICDQLTKALINTTIVKFKYIPVPKICSVDLCKKFEQFLQLTHLALIAFPERGRGPARLKVVDPLVLGIQWLILPETK